jgi:hypothetical protein
MFWPGPGLLLLAFAGDATRLWAARFVGDKGGDGNGNKVWDSIVEQE